MSDRPIARVDISEFKEILEQVHHVQDGATYLIRLPRERAHELAKQWNSWKDRPPIRIILVDDTADLYIKEKK